MLKTGRAVNPSSSSNGTIRPVTALLKPLLESTHVEGLMRLRPSYAVNDLMISYLVLQLVLLSVPPSWCSGNRIVWTDLL